VGHKRAFQPGEGLARSPIPALTSAKAKGETQRRRVSARNSAMLLRLIAAARRGVAVAKVPQRELSRCKATRERTQTSYSEQNRDEDGHIGEKRVDGRLNINGGSKYEILGRHMLTELRRARALNEAPRMLSAPYPRSRRP
jgi:hypothetical protein